MLWGGADSLSSFVRHTCRQAGLANGHTMYEECGRVAVQSFIQTPGIERCMGFLLQEELLERLGSTPIPASPSPGSREDSHQCDYLGGSSQLEVHKGEVLGQERFLVEVQHADVGLDCLPDLHLRHRLRLPLSDQSPTCSTQGFQRQHHQPPAQSLGTMGQVTQNDLWAWPVNE